jgi:hypothetical protein
MTTSTLKTDRQNLNILLAYPPSYLRAFAIKEIDNVQNQYPGKKVYEEFLKSLGKENLIHSNNSMHRREVSRQQIQRVLSTMKHKPLCKFMVKEGILLPVRSPDQMLYNNTVHDIVRQIRRGNVIGTESTGPTEKKILKKNSKENDNGSGLGPTENLDEDSDASTEVDEDGDVIMRDAIPKTISKPIKVKIDIPSVNKEFDDLPPLEDDDLPPLSGDETTDANTENLDEDTTDADTVDANDYEDLPPLEDYIEEVKVEKATVKVEEEITKEEDVSTKEEEDVTTKDDDIEDIEEVPTSKKTLDQERINVSSIDQDFLEVTTNDCKIQIDQDNPEDSIIEFEPPTVIENHEQKSKSTADESNNGNNDRNDNDDDDISIVDQDMKIVNEVPNTSVDGTAKPEEAAASQCLLM